MSPDSREFSWLRSAWHQLPLVVLLVLLWAMLWDEITVLTVVSGLLLALGVMRVFYLPPVLLSGRINPWRCIVLAARMILDIGIASLGIAFWSIDPRYQPMNALIAVRLHTHSDLVMTLTSEAITVVPGTVVVDVDRERAILYLHALGTRTPADVERTRRTVLATEERIVLAIGTREQAETVRSERRARRRARRDPASKEGAS